MYHLIENLRKIGILIYPFMTGTAKDLFSQIGLKEDCITWESIKHYDLLKDIKVIQSGKPLFMRLDSEKEIEFIAEGMKNN
ncbi:Methionine--tRNA ligase [compost metagenome]